MVSANVVVEERKNQEELEDSITVIIVKNPDLISNGFG